jgi:hypothetical protein
MQGNSKIRTDNEAKIQGTEPNPEQTQCEISCEAI